jgi:hypothetical protein
MADKSLLVGDEAGDLLLKYAALLAQIGRGDSVQLRAIGIDGDEVTAGFLLNSGTVMLVESSSSRLPEPDNREAVRYMQERLDSYDWQQNAEPGDGSGRADDAEGDPTDSAGA